MNDNKYGQEYGRYENNHYPNSNAYPAPYENPYSRTESFYREDSEGGGGFIAGAIVGAVIGAAAAMLLTPKTGKEMRENVTSQASTLKDKSMEFSSTAVDKTKEISKTLQEQSGQLMDKVKTMKNKTPHPMDDGTASYEGEEPMEFMDTVSHTVDQVIKDAGDMATSTAEAFKDAVTDDKIGNSNEKNVSKNDASADSYNNSENFGDNKTTNQNHISVVNDSEKQSKL